MGRWYAPLGLAVGFVLIAYAMQSFGASNLTISITILVITSAITFIQFDNRLKSLEERVIHSDYSGIKAAIEGGERHKPKHDQPSSLMDGGAVKSFITAAHEALFADFCWFGAVLNQECSEPWAIEELNDTSVRGIDGPEVGRRYQVYYNACRMGTIQVTVGGSDWLFGPEKFLENRCARVDIELDYLRFVPFDEAQSLIASIALLVGKFGDDGDLARSKASSTAAAALGKHLWESVRNPEIDVIFDFSAQGPYELLRRTTSHWKANGIDPFERWNGDRSWGSGMVGN